jgi:hypothetical protein
MSGTSNVGNSAVYESKDQVTRSDAEIQQEKKENRFHEGKENSHKAQDSSKFLPSMHPLPFVVMRHHLTSPHYTVY